MATRSKAWVCDRSIAGIAGSNPTGGIDVFLAWPLCVVRYTGLCVGLITHLEESYRVCVYVWVFECDREASITTKPWPTCRFMEELHSNSKWAVVPWGEKHSHSTTRGCHLSKLTILAEKRVSFSPFVTDLLVCARILSWNERELLVWCAVDRAS